MKEHKPVERAVSEGLRRRGFLQRVGAGGLVVTAAVFGKTPAAAGATTSVCGCCGLVYCPPNTTLSSCQSVSHYLWVCVNGVIRCSCCEKKNNQGQYYASAYQCEPA